MKTKKTEPKEEPADLRQLVREVAHRTMGSRASPLPLERTGQQRKHGQHRGPRPTK